MTALVEVLLKGLGIPVQPGALSEERQGEDVTVTAVLEAADVERLDGRDHRSAKAVRQILSAAAAAQQSRFHLVVRARA